MYECLDLWEVDFGDCSDPQGAVDAYLAKVEGVGVGDGAGNEIELWATYEEDTKRIVAGSNREDVPDDLYEAAVMVLMEAEHEVRAAMGCPEGKKPHREVNDYSVMTAAMFLIAGTRKMLEAIRAPQLAGLRDELACPDLRRQMVRAALTARYLRRSASAYLDWKLARQNEESEDEMHARLRRIVERWRNRHEH